MITRASARPDWLSLHWLWLLLLGAAFAPTAYWLWGRWTLSVWHNGHGIFIPMIVAYLVWENLRRDPITEPRSSAWGFAFLVPGLAMLALDTAIRTQLLAAAGLVLCLPGLSLLLLGVERTRSLAFPLLLAGLMLPIPAGFVSDLYLGLRQISAWGSTHLVEWWGIPVLRNGTTLLLPTSTIQVTDACSGFSTLYASVTLGLILAYLTPRPSRRAILMLAAVVLAILCNMVRVTALVLIVHYWGADPLKTPLHEASGLVAFGTVIVILFLISGRSEADSATA